MYYPLGFAQTLIIVKIYAMIAESMLLADNAMYFRLLLPCTGFIWWLYPTAAVAGTSPVRTPPDSLRLSEENRAYFRHININAQRVLEACGCAGKV